MEDQDARYLIGEFNKYASWIVKSVDPVFFMCALVTASGALLLSLLGNLDLVSGVPVSIRFLAFVAMVFWPIALTWKAYRLSCKMIDAQERNGKKLVMLENHRAKYRCLPDGLTFETIVNSKLEDLEGLLRRSVNPGLPI